MPILKLSTDQTFLGRLRLQLPERLPLSVYMEGYSPQNVDEPDSRCHHGVILLDNPTFGDSEELTTTAVCFYTDVGRLYDQELLRLLGEEIYLPVLIAVYERLPEVHAEGISIEVSNQAYDLLKKRIQADVAEPSEFYLAEKSPF